MGSERKLLVLAAALVAMITTSEASAPHALGEPPPVCS
jgi:hypothetical protein